MDPLESLATLTLETIRVLLNSNDSEARELLMHLRENKDLSVMVLMGLLTLVQCFATTLETQDKLDQLLFGLEATIAMRNN